MEIQVSLDDFYSAYIDEIELIQFQNKVECDLYSILSFIIRNSKQGRAISLRDVSVRRTTDFSKSYKGEAGFPDFVVRTREKSQNAAILGAVEIKYITVDLDLEDNLEQLNGHIDFYKKVIYTNGIEWRYYNQGETKSECIWTVYLGVFDNEKGIIWKDIGEWKDLLNKLDNINWIDEIV